ncbi:coagulation factor 5 8 type domain containing protein [Grosmannia clavigera kw1407]|uniref:Coagulation factor 5 8 type domain containing protein n=1 Tax=Grosmannia clavigera (strain kw1407 / UAMH 11150) TaxID=655863 RepID=F0XRD2_GROCL|nr:coagulation factor 5 8 type domain containing protein [Grosmannia clavigera kw1407]EFW99717.1 coagulation factor 5 8 type domain containing protein [Grosmannia clavigera kw1407]
MRNIFVVLFFALLAGAGISGRASYTTIPNGQTYYDSAGNTISCVGGGFLQVGTWYYWVGEAFYNSTAAASPDLASLYKSQDLVNWDYVGTIISADALDANGKPAVQYSNLGRPKVVYNAATKKYVFWAHWETATTFAASHVLVATADAVEGPYTISSRGHFRPGSGHEESSALGDRVGGLVVDFGASALKTDNVSHPYQPVSGADYPPKILQFNSKVDPSDPEAVQYVSAADGYGTTQSGELTQMYFGLTLKAVAIRMTPWDTSYYERYSPYWSISKSAYEYIVRYPTATNRSAVTTVVYEVGDPGSARQTLVAPQIGPGLDESTAADTVLVHSGDAAFVTCNTTKSTIYYTTDGTTPTPKNSSTLYAPGTRITISGAAGTNLTVRAVCALGSEVSTVVSQKYTVVGSAVAVPIFRPIVSAPAGVYSTDDAAFQSKGTRIYAPTYNTELYFTMDGYDPEPPVFGTNTGYRARDMTVWQDPADGKAYLVHASDNVFFRLWQLDDSFTDVVPERGYDVYSDLSREAPALVRHGGTSGQYVYLITSTQTGWYPNQGGYSRTANITAGFGLPRDPVTGYRNGNETWSSIAPFGDATTFGSQPTFILDIGTTADPQYVYVGDRNKEIDQSDNTYIFLPLTLNDTGVAFTGETAGGLASIEFTPFLDLDLAGHRIVPPAWTLLSRNKPTDNSTANVALTAAQLAAGTYNFSAAVANDGVDFDLSFYDAVEQYYKPTAVPYHWQVDLGQTYALEWIGLSFLSVGGSDAANRYTLTGSNDGATWHQLADNTANLQPGFCDHIVTGNSYRYVRLDVSSIYDVIHDQEADWEAGLYEVYVYGQKA